MSKVSSYVAAYNAAEAARPEAFKYKGFESNPWGVAIDERGRAVFAKHMTELSPEDALRLGRWLIAAYGEADREQV